ncbi:MAG: GGDEF domain-containing protein [Methylovulum sp.]|nr:GGDEF domain-containing protein [Methylovulum sp.]
MRNRLAFYEDAKAESGSIIFLDLDGFKNLNDTYGHEIGDYYLKGVALKLIQITAELSATPYRFGGDEFVIKICKSMLKEKVINIAKQILAELKVPVIIKSEDYKLSCSIGVSFYKEIFTIDDIIHQADLAMYQAKRGGKSQYALYDEKLNYVDCRRQRSADRNM